VPLIFCSTAVAFPYSFKRVLLKEDITVNTEGQHVIFLTPSATPYGPSSKFNAGIYNSGIAGTLPT
jgi:hypothetical protein